MAATRLGVHRRNNGGRTVKTLCILFLAFILNGVGLYLAYRLITWFENQPADYSAKKPYKQNVRDEK